MGKREQISLLSIYPSLKFRFLELSQPIARLRFFEDLPIVLVTLREDLEALLGRTAG